MTPRRALLLTACSTLAIAVSALYLSYVRQARDRTEPEELSRNAALSRPEWANYQEDIKAHLGATPAAQWKGRPVSAQLTGNVLEVIFELSGPWAEYGFVLPILMRDALGDERRQTAYVLDSPRVTYIFHLPERQGSTPIPWILIKYPNHEDRLVLDPQGAWKAN